MPDSKKSQLLMAVTAADGREARTVSLQAAGSSKGGLVRRMTYEARSKRSAVDVEASEVTLDAVSSDGTGSEAQHTGQSVGVCGFLVPSGPGALARYGLVLNRRNEITEVTPGSDAEVAGVMETGDRVVTVDGESLVEIRDDGFRYNRPLEPLLEKGDLHFVQVQ